MPYLGIGDVGIAKGDIVADSARKKENILQYYADMRAQKVEVIALQRPFINQNFAFIDFIKSVQKIDDGRLARSGSTH